MISGRELKLSTVRSAEARSPFQISTSETIRSMRCWLVAGRSDAALKKVVCDSAASNRRPPPNARAETSMAKLFCCEGAAEVAQAAMRVAGAYGLSDQFDFERYTRDAISLPIVGGSSNMQKNNIANRLRLES